MKRKDIYDDLKWKINCSLWFMSKDFSALRVNVAHTQRLAADLIYIGGFFHSGIVFYKDHN